MKLSQDYIEFLTKITLAEDIGDGDLTARLIPKNKTQHGKIITREQAIFCGKDFASSVFNQVDNQLKVDWFVNDGDLIQPNQILCTVYGNARSLLTAERSALNFLQLLSGTSTVTHHYVQAISGTQSVVLDTRKTIPSLRLAQKYAVSVGGGKNQRLGLYDGILIKENHILACGGIKNAVEQAQITISNSDLKHNITLQVEVETIDELIQALDAQVALILLDNFSLDQMSEAVEINKNKYNNQAILEASGGIDLNSIRSIAETGVHRISIGKLTKDLLSIDLSMRLE